MKKQNLIRKVVSRDYLPTKFPWTALLVLYVIADILNDDEFWKAVPFIMIFFCVRWVIQVFTEQECEIQELIDDTNDNYLNLP